MLLEEFKDAAGPNFHCLELSLQVARVEIAGGGDPISTLPVDENCKASVTGEDWSRVTPSNSDPRGQNVNWGVVKNGEDQHS